MGTRDATHASPSSTYCAKKQCTDSSQCSTGVCVGGVCKVPPTTSAPSTSPSKSPTKSPSKSPTSSPSSAPTAETFLLKIDGFHGSPIDALVTTLNLRNGRLSIVSIMFSVD